MVKYIKRFNQRIQKAPHSGDIEFFAKSNSEAIDKISVPKIGNATDTLLSDGVKTTNIVSKNQIMYGGIQNKFFGTTAGLVGAKLGNLNSDGSNADTFRRIKRVLRHE